jgi:hypothetical protein
MKRIANVFVATLVVCATYIVAVPPALRLHLQAQAFSRPAAGLLRTPLRGSANRYLELWARTRNTLSAEDHGSTLTRKNRLDMLADTAW